MIEKSEFPPPKNIYELLVTRNRLKKRPSNRERKTNSKQKTNTKQKTNKKQKTNTKQKTKHVYLNTIEVFDRYKKLLSDFWHEDNSYSSTRKEIEELKRSSEETIEKALRKTNQQLLEEKNSALERADFEQKSIIRSVQVAGNTINERVTSAHDCLEPIGFSYLLKIEPEKSSHTQQESTSLLELHRLVDKARETADLVEKQVKRYKELIALEKKRAQERLRKTATKIPVYEPPKIEKVDLPKREKIEEKEKPRRILKGCLLFVALMLIVTLLLSLLEYFFSK